MEKTKKSESHPAKYQKPVIIYLGDLQEGSGQCTIGSYYSLPSCKIGPYVGIPSCSYGANFNPNDCYLGSKILLRS